MSNEQLKGIHHITAMTSSAEKNYHFFTEVLGIRLVKKTVNQDDIQTYHTFFADDVASPGTDMTFFDFPNNPKGKAGTNSISRSGFRVPSDEALTYWIDRFDQFHVKHEGISTLLGKKMIRFVDADEQAYQLVSDEGQPGVEAGIPWKKGPVPSEYGIVGLGPVEITISYLSVMESWLVNVLGFQKVAVEGNKHLYEVGKGGNGGQVILVEDKDSVAAVPGYGEVHHVAFRVEDRAALDSWINKLAEMDLPNSGYVNRFYFESLYVRVGHILFEFATDGPGFMQDEPYEKLGEKLSLPPFLEPKRQEIERAVRPFDTSRKE